MKTFRAAGAALLGTAIVLIVTACSAGAATSPVPTTAPTPFGSSPVASPSAQATPVSTATPTSTSTPRTLDAAGVIGELKSAGLPITLTVTYSATSDPNHLLGRPNGYQSKASFKDGRVKASDANDSSLGSVDLGGSIEVYPSSAGATGRAQYIQQSLKGFPMLGTEYDYVAGSVLVRVSGLLTPDQATGYQTALTAIVGMPAQLITAG